MQSASVSFFGIFLFIVVQVAACPALIMWKTPLQGMDFLCELLWSREKSGLDWITGKDLGLQELEPQAVLLHHASLWVRFVTDRGRRFITDGSFCLLELAVMFEASYIEAERGLDFHSSHSQQTINDIESNSHNLNGSTSSTHLLFQILIALFQTMKTCISSHQQRDTPFTTQSQGRITPNLISATLYVEPLESIFLKKKLYISLVDFVLWLAISKSAILKDKYTFNMTTFCLLNLAFF